MTKAGEQLIEAAKEAVSVARGKQPAARITIQGQHYVPEVRWKPASTAPRDGTATFVLLGETIPDMPNGRVGTWISDSECEELGETCPSGAWLIWNSSWDWFVTANVLAWCELPPSPYIETKEK